jgi:hypothetical protein
MKKTLLLIGLVLVTAAAMSQTYKTVELKPITQQGWKYFYDLKRVTGPAALEVPLIAVNDEEVTHHLKGFRTYQTIESVVVIIPLVYVLSLPRNQYVDPNTFWWVLGGTLAVQLGMEALSHVQLGKAIDKYNMIILRPSGRSFGLELTWRFL